MAGMREQRRIVAYLDGLSPIGLLRERQAKVNALPALHLSRRSLSRCFLGWSQSTTGEELSVLMPSAEGATVGRGVSG